METIPWNRKGRAPAYFRLKIDWFLHSSIYMVTTFKEPGRNVALKSCEALDNIAGCEKASGQAVN